MSSGNKSHVRSDWNERWRDEPLTRVNHESRTAGFIREIRPLYPRRAIGLFPITQIAAYALHKHCFYSRCNSAFPVIRYRFTRTQVRCSIGNYYALSFLAFSPIGISLCDSFKKDIVVFLLRHEYYGWEICAENSSCTVAWNFISEERTFCQKSAPLPMKWAIDRKSVGYLSFPPLKSKRMCLLEAKRPFTGGKISVRGKSNTLWMKGEISQTLRILCIELFSFQFQQNPLEAVRKNNIL